MPPKRKQNTPRKTKSATGDLASQITRKQVSLTSKDMAHWRQAKREATNIDMPKRVKLTDLVDDLMHDTHLSSQIDLRTERSQERPYVILRGDKVDDELTRELRESTAFGDLIEQLLLTPYWGHTLLELLPPDSDNDLFRVSLLPRQHVVPRLGILLRDTSDSDGIHYRELPEYGTSIVEAGNPDDLGILFDCSPDTIYRRHAKAAWSEFCEIYGIPPRTLKMDTMDDEAFRRAQEMMRTMGRAAWQIIDTTEEMQFATGLSDNGSIFANLISAAEQSISVKICGAVIGQDTRNGNRSKEETSLKLLNSKCASDRRLVERWVNSSIFPALYRLGILPEGCTLAYEQEDNTHELFDRTTALLPFYDVDEDWIRNTFGIEVTGRKSSAADSTQLHAQLSAESKGEPDFFD